MVKSQATTMKIKNKNGRSHAAFSAFDRPPGLCGSAKFLSRVDRLCGEINPLDNYCLGNLQTLLVMPGLDPGIHALGQQEKTWMAGHRRAETTPSFRRLRPGHDGGNSSGMMYRNGQLGALILPESCE